MKLPLRVPSDPWLYAFARLLLVGVVRGYGRFSAQGTGELPFAGPAIVVANHPSDVDPILLGVSFPRTLHFMADVVQFRRGFVGPVIRRLAAFPIDKGSPDRRSLETALALLRRGEVVALFPEGDLYRQAEPEPFGPGIGFLAARSGAPVIPACLTGAERIWDGRRPHWPRVTLRVGPALRFADGPAVGGRQAGRRGRGAYVRFAEETRAAVLGLHDDDPRRRSRAASAPAMIGRALRAWPGSPQASALGYADARDTDRRAARRGATPRTEHEP